MNVLEPLASSPGWVGSGEDRHPLLRAFAAEAGGGRITVVAQLCGTHWWLTSLPVVPLVLWPCQNTVL